MVLRKGKRSRANLLIEWSPGRVWMEALEARALLSGIVSDDVEVRPGYFKEWGPGSYAGAKAMSLYTNPLWVDGPRFNGAVMSLWGAAPEAQRVYVRVPGSYYDANDPKTPAANRWQIASIVDVPGPTFEVHANLLLPETEGSYRYNTKIALVNDYGDDSYVFSGPVLLSGTSRLVRTAYSQHMNSRFKADTNSYELRDIVFYDRKTERSEYRVTLDYQDGSSPLTFDVASSPDGTFHRNLSFTVPAGQLQTGEHAVHVTIATPDSGDLLEWDDRVFIYREEITPSEQPTRFEWFWNVDSLYRPTSKPIDSLDAVYTNASLAAGMSFSITWADGTTSEATATPSDAPGIDYELFGLKNAYTLHFPAHPIEPGYNMMTVRLTGGGLDLSLDAGVIGLPEGMSHRPDATHSYRTNESTRSDYSNIVFADDVGHDASEYTAWIELDDGSRVPAHLQPSWQNSFAQGWSIMPDAVFWSPTGKLADWNTPRIPATWVVRRGEAELRFKADIQVEPSDWIEPADPHDLFHSEYGDSVPQLARIERRDFMRLSSTTGQVRFPLLIEPNVDVSKLTATMRWSLEDGHSTPATIVRNDDGTYAVEASYDLGQGWRYSHVDLLWRGEPLNSMSMRVYVGEEPVFTDNAYAWPWDFYLKPDFDWGRAGLALRGPCVYLIEPADGPVWAEASFDDGSPARLLIQPAEGNFDGIGAAYTTYLQAYLDTPGWRKLTLTVHAGSHNYSTELDFVTPTYAQDNLYDGPITAEELKRHGGIVYLETDPNPLVSIGADEVDALRFGQSAFRTGSDGKVLFKVPATVMNEQLLAKVKIWIDWGDGSTELVSLIPDDESGYVILAEHRYAIAGKHDVNIRAEIGGVLIESTTRSVTSFPEAGYLWRGNPDYSEIASGIDYGAADTAFDLPKLIIPDHGLDTDQIKVTLTFDDGSPVNVYWECTSEEGEAFIYSNFQVYFDKPGARTYTLRVAWAGKQAELRGTVNAREYSLDWVKEVDSGYVRGPDGWLLIPLGEHEISGGWFGSIRALKPAEQPTEPASPQIPSDVTPDSEPVNGVESDIDEEIGADVGFGWDIGFRDDLTFNERVDARADRFFDEEEEAADWLEVVA